MSTATPGTGIEATYTVDGMTCAHCVNAVTSEVSALDGVREVEVDLAGGLVRVRSEQPLAEAAVAGAVEEAGYQLVPTVPPAQGESGGCCGGGGCH
ncbi:cation transporter [Streptomyces sp. DSM 44915]|uniref:Cation transporter n=1 Tax=Streptomyces chisholmiae TaxID=3075540 RepID=A0ABU2K162_9ACTN|nr:cation transporter [Streptomyces sp. DSM 44915]MDT0270499.1 cation transporter [Streptomyces sp. DSM 44915]